MTCTSYGASSIGIVYAKDGDSNVDDAQLANEILDEVFQDVSDAYVENYAAMFGVEPDPFTK